MSVITIPGDGLFFNPHGSHSMKQYSVMTSVGILDAVGESCAIVGRLSISDKGSAKSLTNAKLWFRSSTGTLLSGSTNLRFGIQDVNASGVNDDSFDIYADIAATSLSVNTWQSVTLNTGSKNVSNGDLLAIVVEMTARGGADIYRHAGIGGSYSNISFPYTVTDTGAGPSKSTPSYLPSFLIEFADGEVGKIDQAYPFTDPGQLTASTTIQSGMYFTAPMTGRMHKVEIGCLDSFATTDDITITVWQDPLGARTSLGTTSMLGAYVGNTGQTILATFMLSSPISLTAGTVYGITVHTTVGSINYSFAQLGAATESNLRKITPFGETVGYISRNSPFTGAFTSLDYYLPAIGFYMDQIDTGSAVAGGNFTFG